MLAALLVSMALSTGPANVPSGVSRAQCRQMLGRRVRSCGSSKALWTTGASGSYASTPDSVANSIAGDVDIRIKLAATDWTPAIIQYPFSKYNAAATGTFLFSIAATSGIIGFTWVESGGTVRSVNCAAAPVISDGQTLWLRVTLQVNNGSGGHVVTFYTSTNGSSWAQLGSTASAGAFTTNLQDGADSLNLGAYGNTGSGSPFAGKIYIGELRNGINGTVVARFNANNCASSAATCTSSVTGEVWTINAPAFIR